MRSASSAIRVLAVVVSLPASLSGCGQSPQSLINDDRALVDANAPPDSASTSSVVAAVEDWPRMSGPAGDHRSPETGLNWDWPADGPPVAWQQPCGSGYGMPVVSDGATYVLAKQDDRTTITARSNDDGAEIWTWDAAPAAYVDDFDDYSDGPYSTPTVRWGVVYAITGDGLLVAVRADTGEELRRLDLMAEFGASVGAFPWGTSPCACEVDAQKRLIINVGGADAAGIVSLNADTFEEIWRSTDEGRSYASPRVFVAGDKLVVLFLTQQNAVLLDASSGDLLWKKRFGVRGDPKLRANSVSPLVVGRDPVRAFLTAGPGAGLLEVTITSPQAVEAEMFGALGRRTLDSQFNNLTHDGARLYGFTSKWNRQANLRCISLADGELLWEYDSVLQRGASICIDDRLLVLGEEGHLAVIETGDEGPNVQCQTAEPVVTGPCFTAPVIVDGRLLVRTERQVSCFDLTKPKSD